MKTIYFESPAAFREWLEAHHVVETELVVGFHKRASGRPSMTWPESVDEALCFGWIDGVRRRVDEDRYTIRFTPRRPTSIWSAINIGRVAVLTGLGRMRPAGVQAFERRTDKRSSIYAYERRNVAALDEASEARFRRKKKAWAFFEAQAPWYRRTATHWVISAKREETREKRLAKLIDDSANGRRIARLTPTPRAK